MYPLTLPKHSCCLMNCFEERLAILDIVNIVKPKKTKAISERIQEEMNIITIIVMIVKVHDIVEGRDWEISCLRVSTSLVYKDITSPVVLVSK